MIKVIDLHKAIETINHCRKQVRTDNPASFGAMYNAAITEAIEALEAMESVDLEKYGTYHAHWNEIFIEDLVDTYTKQYNCSNCGEKTRIVYKRKMNFCPDCGCKMDEN